MSIKQDLLNEINKKSQKTKDLRNLAKTPKDVEYYVFKFFEECESIVKGSRLDSSLVYVLIFFAKAQLQEQLRLKFDPSVVVEVVKNSGGNIIGVQITWSPHYTIANKCSDSLFIGVEQMLFG
jgi:hypothetical protein